MLSDKQINLSKHRIEKAKGLIEEADLLFHHELYKGSNNRAYYAILHSLRAVLALVDFDSKKHSGVIAEFQRLYVKTEMFEREYSKMIMAASEIRNSSDYDDYYIASKAETEKQVANAKKLYERICIYLGEQYSGH